MRENIGRDRKQIFQGPEIKSNTTFLKTTPLTQKNIKNNIATK